MSTKDNNGYILITCLLLLLVLTVIGLSAIGTSTVDNMLSGNVRIRESNLSTADSGASVSAAVIEKAVRDQEVDGFAGIVYDSNLATELRSDSFNSDDYLSGSDLNIALCSGNITTTVAVDMDKMYTKWMGGSAIEFASGYEGVGKGGGASFYTYYRINSVSTGIGNTQTCVGCIYKYAPR